MTTTEKSTKTVKNGKTTTLHMHHSFATFLCRHCAGLVSPFVGGVNTRQRLPFSFLELRYSLLEFNSRKSCQHLTNWTRWSKRKKKFVWLFVRFHFLSVVFVAVGAVVAFKLSNIKYPLFSVESYKVATLKKRKQKPKTTIWQYINQTFTTLVSELNS